MSSEQHHPEELAFYTNDQLMMELMNRFDHAVFNGCKRAAGEEHFFTRWQGDFVPRVGLIGILNYQMQRRNEINERETNGFNPGEPPPSDDEEDDR